jgi:hypothetical protein
MAVASIKGVAVQLVADAIQKLLSTGSITRDELEVALEKQDLELLDGGVVPGLWYPISSFARLLTLALERDGRTEPEDWTRVGFEIANKLLAGRAHQEVVSTAKSWGDRSGFALVNLAPLFLNFSSWSFEKESRSSRLFRVEVTDAREFPDVLRYMGQGVVEFLATQVQGRPVEVVSDRPAPDLVVFRTVRP